MRKPRPGRFEKAVTDRLRKEFKGTRANIPEGFVSTKRDDSVTESHDYSQPSQGRPKGITKSTAAKLERIARLQAAGLKQPAIAAKLRMDPDALRRFLHRYRDAFQQIKERSQ